MNAIKLTTGIKGLKIPKLTYVRTIRTHPLPPSRGSRPLSRIEDTRATILTPKPPSGLVNARQGRLPALRGSPSGPGLRRSQDRAAAPSGYGTRFAPGRVF